MLTTIDITIFDIVVDTNNNYFEIIKFIPTFVFNEYFAQRIICKCIYTSTNMYFLRDREYAFYEKDFIDGMIMKVTKEQLHELNKLIIFSK